MNIFAFDTHPYKAALWLDDIRKNKMITEGCQLMSTTMNLLDPNHKFEVYRNFNPSHGSCVWTRASCSNFYWLLSYTKFLNKQRGLNVDGTPHKCAAMIPVFDKWFEQSMDLFSSSLPQRFSNNAANTEYSISYKWVNNPVLAYRMYINDRWKLTDQTKPTWRFGERPYWFSVI